MTSATAADTPSSLTKRVATLAWPILIGQLAVIANGVIDTLMTARQSATDLAALGIGASVYISIFVGLSGVMQALSPMIAQLYGGKKFDAIGEEVRQGVWLSLFLTVLGSIALCFPQPLLGIAQASPELEEKVLLYLRVAALALPATLGRRAGWRGGAGLIVGLVLAAGSGAYAVDALGGGSARISGSVADIKDFSPAFR